MPCTSSRRLSLAAAALAAAVLAGCGAAEEDSADRFTGEDARVAQIVDDLQTAAEEGDAAEICSRLLTRELVDALATRGSNCTAELDKAIEDADDYELDVRDVAITGTRATARVRDSEGTDRSIAFVRQGNGWRATSIG